MCTANDPEIDLQSSRLQIDSHNLCSPDLEVPIRVRWHDIVPSLTHAKHAITSHLDIERMLLAISVLVRQDPFHSLTITRQALQGNPVFTPYEPFVTSVPVELEVFSRGDRCRQRQLNFDPVGRPTWTEGGVDVGGFKVVRSSFCECWTGQAGWRVD
jgi:hypothetical protein